MYGMLQLLRLRALPRRTPSQKQLRRRSEVAGESNQPKQREQIEAFGQDAADKSRISTMYSYSCILGAQFSGIEYFYKVSFTIRCTVHYSEQ